MPERLSYADMLWCTIEHGSLFSNPGVTQDLAFDWQIQRAQNRFDGQETRS